MENPHWLGWARRLKAIAQIGIEYCKDPYDRQRYEEIQRLAAEMTAKSAGLADIGPLVDLFKNDVGYATPKIDIRTAVFDQDRILLVRERADGLWTLPGGWADIGESPSSAAVREVKEESGYEIVAIGMQCELTGPDVLLRATFLDQSLGQLRAFAISDHPPGNVTAEHVEDHVEVEVGPLDGSEQLADVPTPQLIRSRGQEFRFLIRRMGQLVAALAGLPALLEQTIHARMEQRYFPSSSKVA